MVKFAKSGERDFNPIEKHTVHSIAAPAPQTPSPAPPEDTLPAPEPQPEPAKAKSQRAKKSVTKPLSGPRAPERLTQVVKCLFTPTEERELRKLVSRLSEGTTSLTLSHLIRPYF